LEGVASIAGINFGEGDEARRQLRLWTGAGSDFGVLDEAAFVWVAWRGRRFVDAAEMLWPLWSALDSKKMARVSHQDIDKALSAAGSAMTAEGLGLQHLQAEVLELFKYHAGCQDAIVFADFLALVCDMQDRFALAQIAGKGPLLCTLRYDRGISFLRPMSAHVFAPPDETTATPDALDSPPPLAAARSPVQQVRAPQPELSKTCLASNIDDELNMQLHVFEDRAYPEPQIRDSLQAASCADASRPEADSLPEPRLLLRSCAEQDDQVHSATLFDATRLLEKSYSGPLHANHHHLQRRRMRAPSEASDDMHWPSEAHGFKGKRVPPATQLHRNDQARSSSYPVSLMFRSNSAEGSAGSQVFCGPEVASGGQKQDHQSVVPSDGTDLPSVYPWACAETTSQRRPPLAPAEVSELSEEEALKVERCLLEPHERTARELTKTLSHSILHRQKELPSSTVHACRPEHCFHGPRRSSTPPVAKELHPFPWTAEAKPHHALLAPPEPSDDSDGLAGKHARPPPCEASCLMSRMQGHLASPSTSSSVSKQSCSGQLPFLGTGTYPHTMIPCASLNADAHLQKDTCRPSEHEGRRTHLRERGQLTLWQEVTDPSSGLTYWWNRSTNETTHAGAPKPHPGPLAKTNTGITAIEVPGSGRHAVYTERATAERSSVQQRTGSCRAHSAGPTHAMAQTMAHRTLQETHHWCDKERVTADAGSEGLPDFSASSHSRHAAVEDEDTGTGGTLGTSRNDGEGFEDDEDVEADVEGSGESDLEW